MRLEHERRIEHDAADRAVVQRQSGRIGLRDAIANGIEVKPQTRQRDTTRSVEAAYRERRIKIERLTAVMKLNDAGKDVIFAVGNGFDDHGLFRMVIVRPV